MNEFLRYYYALLAAYYLDPTFTCSWIPASFLIFWKVPQHSNVLAVTGFSFLHKIYLSWRTNQKPKHQAVAES